MSARPPSANCPRWHCFGPSEANAALADGYLLTDFRLRFLRLICNSYIIRYAADSPVEFIDFIWESVASFVKLGNSKRRSKTWQKIGPQPFEY